MTDNTLIPELENKFQHGRVQATIKMPDFGIKFKRLARMRWNIRFCGIEHLYPFIVVIDKNKAPAIPFIYQGYENLPYIQSVLHEFVKYTREHTFRELLDEQGNPDAYYSRDNLFKLRCYMLKTYNMLQHDNPYYKAVRRALNMVFDNMYQYQFLCDSDYRTNGRTTVARSCTFKAEKMVHTTADMPYSFSEWSRIYQNMVVNEEFNRNDASTLITYTYTNEEGNNNDNQR